MIRGLRCRVAKLLASNVVTLTSGNRSSSHHRRPGRNAVLQVGITSLRLVLVVAVIVIGDCDYEGEVSFSARLGILSFFIRV